MSTLANMNGYEWRWKVLLTANTVPTTKVNGDLHHTYVNNFVCVSSCLCVLAKLLRLALTYFSYFVRVIKDNNRSECKVCLRL